MAGSHGRQSTEFAGNFGPHAVPQAVLAAGQRSQEEGHLFVAELDIGRQSNRIVAALHVERFDAGRFRVLEDQVLVIVLAVDREFDLEQVAAFDFAEIGQRHAARMFRPLANDLAPRAGDIRRLVAREPTCNTPAPP